MGTDIIVTAASGKYAGAGVSRIFPFIQHGKIVIRIQVRYAHRGQIRNGIVQVIVFIIDRDFTAVWNILAELVLEKKFFAPCALFVKFTGGSKWCIIVCTEIIDRAEHTVIEKSQSGSKASLVALACHWCTAVENAAELSRGTHSKIDRRRNVLCQCLCKLTHLVNVSVVGIVHLAIVADKKSLKDINTVGMGIYCGRNLLDVVFDAVKIRRLRFLGFAVPVIEKAKNDLFVLIDKSKKGGGS